MHLSVRFSTEKELKQFQDLLYEKSGQGVSFTGLLEAMVSEVTIVTAVHNIKSNKGSKTAGVDRMKMDKYLQMPKEELFQLIQSNISNYKPKPAKRKYIEKANGKKRPLGIPTVLDRIIQECMRLILEPICEAKFYPHSYGFRPYRAQKHAIRDIVNVINASVKSKDQPVWAVEGDIKGCFDNINHRLLLKKLWRIGIHDSWAANYGETVTAIELSPEGTGYRAKTRFAKFYNLPELMSVFKNVADIQTVDMLKLPVPEARYHNIALKPSEYQKEIVASLAERAEKVRNRMVDSSVDNMLLITNDGRKLALDQRLVNPMLPSDPNSKSAKCAENVFEIWQRTAGQRSTQMIFCDLSTPKDDGTFSVYDDIHAKLLELGIPENEIAFIHNAKSEVQKKDLFGKVRSGQVRILLGSTQRMGAGTNCQQKLIALHHLDCPWRPSDLQQREGRIIRQGNENPEVDIYSYVTEGTFDAYLYQLVESKQKFISQIMTSKSPVRSAEDVDEQALSYAEIKALASGNPMIKEKMDLDIEVSKLKLLKANHLSQKYALEDAISKGFPKQIAETQARIAGYGADIATVKENTHPNGDGFSPLTLAGVTHANKKEAGAALLTMCQTMLSPEATQIGSYRGLTLELAFDTFAQEYRLTMIGQLRHTVTLGTDVFGNLQRMDNALEGLPIKEQACREQLSNLKTQLETAKAEVQKQFPREEELTTKTARLEELNSLLNLDHKEPEIVDAEPDEDQRPPERRRPQLER